MTTTRPALWLWLKWHPRFYLWLPWGWLALESSGQQSRSMARAQGEGKATTSMKIHVELVMVHLANDGEETYELAFVDEFGTCGSALIVRPDGTMEIGIEKTSE